MAGLLLALIDIPEAYAEEFHAWYDTEHIPERAAVPAIGRIARWTLRKGTLPPHLATYEVDSVGELQTGPYQALKARGDTPWSRRLKGAFTRTIRGVFELAEDYGGDGGPPGACAVALTEVPDDALDRYREWYAREHGPQVAAVPGVSRARRFERHDRPQHLSLIELADDAVLGSADYAAAKAAAPGEDLRTIWTREQGIYTLRSVIGGATAADSGEATR